MIRFAHGAATDVGRVRGHNEDSLLVAEALFAVADGMGGHRGGEVASADALETLRTTVLDPDAAAIHDAVLAANRHVFERSVTEPQLAGMGTTLCVVALVHDEDSEQSIAIANVGDSRVYLLRDGGFRQITLDHSLVETMVRGGQLSPDEAAVHPGRNVLTRALGIEPDLEVDLFSEPVAAGDRYLLCSDGLYNELSDDEIAATLRRVDAPWDAASELVAAAVDAGGRDNVTVVVVDVIDDDGSGRVDGLIGTSALADADTAHLEETDVAPTAQLPVVDATEPGDAAPDEATATPTSGSVPDDAIARASEGGAPSAPRRAPGRLLRTLIVLVIIAVAVGIGVVLASRNGPDADGNGPPLSSTSTTSTTTTSTTTTTTTTVSEAVPGAAVEPPQPAPTVTPEAPATAGP